jgi:hypothetical protein
MTGISMTREYAELKKQTNVDLATQTFWEINKIWTGRGGKITVGRALQLLNAARMMIGPQHTIYKRICNLIDDIVHNQQETPAKKQA